MAFRQKVSESLDLASCAPEECAHILSIISLDCCRDVPSHYFIIFEAYWVAAVLSLAIAVSDSRLTRAVRQDIPLFRVRSRACLKFSRWSYYTLGVVRNWLMFLLS